ncbi:MAG: hypothetical protein HRU15_04580, partial [Planctomycetes bacterium]|nr:hypothetical protein [Planctomycetota bacterium]
IICASDHIEDQHFEFHQKDETQSTSFLSLAELEAAHIAKALKHCNGNKSQAAKLLGISRPTIHKKIGDYGLDSDNKQ